MAITPVWQQKVAASALDARRITRSFIDNPGIVSGLALTATSPTSMAVNVGAGRAFVSESGSSLGGSYHVVNDDTIGPFTITAANATLDRIDKVVLTVRDSFISGTNNDAIVQVITGSAATLPSAPATPTNSIVLGTVLVPAGSTTVSTSRITTENTSDVARMSYSLVPQAIPCRSTSRPTLDLINGLKIHETDTGISRVYLNGMWTYLSGDISTNTISELLSQSSEQRKYWPVISVSAYVRAGVVQANIRFRRKTSTLTVPSSGNIVNSSICSIKSPFRPPIAAPMSTTTTGRLVTGYVSSTGNLVMANLMGGGDVSPGYEFVVGYTASIKDIYAVSAAGR